MPRKHEELNPNNATRGLANGEIFSERQKTL
jgi:hypothetical protein